ncbi:MAG TPA: hypothetical protein VMW10_10785, partial [Alphaproteobacteria bacterium]|nr:hypothetical protein [Alphaproteobacteria bacterium]
MALGYNSKVNLSSVKSWILLQAINIFHRPLDNFKNEHALKLQNLPPEMLTAIFSFLDPKAKR